MDYLDPRKELEHRIILMVGYVCVAIAIVFATVILVYEAYGFGLGKNGTVIQNGLAFISSQPSPAQIYINGVLNKARTDARLVLPANTYQIRLARPGYHDWQRTIELQGGSVVHFDYPFLFPTKLTTTKLQSYSSAPGLVTQSPDRRWVVVQQPGSMTTFDLYDLKNPTKAPVDISLPANLLSAATGSESWQFGEWADDNLHVLLQHDYDGKTEFILLDRQNPDQSLNLNTTLSVTPTKLTLDNKKFDQYYLYDSTAGNLQTATLSTPSPVPVLEHVLSYQTYASDTILYATDTNAPAGKVFIKLDVGGQTYDIHTLTTSSDYLLDVTKYAGVLYVAAGSSSENKVYIYRDPVAQLAAAPTRAIVPSQVLHVENPNYLSFSSNAQFIVAEDGTRFGVYDIQNKVGFNYTASLGLDTPQQHASWMDGDRLSYVSGGKLVVFDYDDTNQQVLMPDNAAYTPIFAPDYKYVYGWAGTTTPSELDVTQTALLIPTDL